MTRQIKFLLSVYNVIICIWMCVKHRYINVIVFFIFFFFCNEHRKSIIILLNIYITKLMFYLITKNKERACVPCDE